MNKYNKQNKKQRQEIKNKIKKALFDYNKALFAYLYGSFLDSRTFRDIDIGIYLKKESKMDDFKKELLLADKLAAITGLPPDIFEITILNSAPGSFLNNIFAKGELLLSNNDKILAELIEKTSLESSIDSHISYQSLKELIPV